MSGRRREHGERRPQAPKKAGGFERGHGMHHRPGGGKPRLIGTGRRRMDRGQREGAWTGLNDEQLADLASAQKRVEGRPRLEELADDSGRGVRLEGAKAAGTVLEVMRGCCHVALHAPPVLPAGSTPPPKLLRTVPRGTMEQFDLGVAGLVAVGDEVEVIVPPVQGDEAYEGVLERVLPRASAFRRLHPSGRAIQTLAANIAQVVIVTSTAEPDFRPGFVDRVLVCAAASDVPAVLVINKCDLGLPAETAELLEVYRGLGLRVVQVSALTGQGLDEFREVLSRGRSMLCGHSGVGKSSLLVALAPHLAPDIRIEGVSAHTGKGLHTTVHAKLYQLGFCAVVDTPGVREFTPADTDRRNLWAWFPEIATRQGGCTFANCSHTVEKGCAIVQAVADGAMHPRRHESYVRIYETLSS